MKTYKRTLLTLLISMSFFASAQVYNISSIYEYNYYLHQDVNVGAVNKAIYGFSLYSNQTISTVTSVCFSVGGTFTPLDIVPNGFKLWSSKTTYLTESAYIIQNTNVAYPSTVAGDNNVCFTGSFTLPGLNTTYLFLTADIEETATHDATLQVLGAPVVSIAGSTLSYNNAQTNAGDVAIKTFTSKGINKWYDDESTNITPNSKARLFSMYTSGWGPTSFNFGGLAVSVSGNMLSSEIDKYTLEYYDGYYGRRFIVSSVTGFGAESINMPPLYLPALPVSYNGYFELFAHISSTAGVGKTLQVGKLAGTDFIMAGSSHTGTITGFPTYTVGVGNATVSSINMSPISIYKEFPEPIYKFKIHNGNTRVKFQNMQFTVTGINVSNNSSYAYLKYYQGNDAYNQSSYLSYAYPMYVNDNTLIYNFVNINKDLESDTDYYFYFTQFTNSGLSNSGDNIKVSAATINNESFESMNLTGSLTAGTTHNFQNSSTAISKINVPVRPIPVGNEGAIYAFQLLTASPGKANMTLVVTLSGTFTSDDYSHLYLYSSIDNTFDIDDNYITNFYESFNNVYNSYTFSQDATKNYFIVFGSETEATVGRTVKLEKLTATSSNGAVSINANVVAGSTYTINRPTVSISAQNDRVSTIAAPGSRKSLIYTLKMSVATTDAYLANFQYKVEGSFASANYNLYRYLSEYPDYNPDLYNFISESSSYSPSAGNTYNGNLSGMLTAGKDYYIHFVVYPYDNAFNNKTIRIETITGIDLDGAIKIGNPASGPLCTVTSVLTVQPNSNVVFKNFAPSTGSHRVLVHSFKAHSNSYEELRALHYNVATNLNSSELVQFTLYKGSYAGDLSTKEIAYMGGTSVFPTGTGANLKFNGLNTSISDSQEEGIHLFATISTTATGKTIQVSLAAENISFDGIVMSTPTNIQGPTISSILPQATATSQNLEAKSLNPIGVYYPIYRMAIATNAVTRVSQMVLSLAGTYTQNDIEYIQISHSKFADGRSTQNTKTYATTKAESSIPGEYLVFNTSSGEYDIDHDTLYISIKAYATNGGVSGRDIQVKMVSVLGLSSGTVINNTAEGTKFTLGAPEVICNYIFPMGRKMHNYTYPVLATLKIEVKGADAKISSQGISYKPIGDFAPNLYSIQAVLTKNEVFNLEDNTLINSYSQYYPSKNNSYTLFSNISLPIGTYYVHMYSYNHNMYEGSTHGISMSGINFVNGSVTGNGGGIGNLMTIAGNSWVVNSLPIPKSKVLTGTRNAVFASFMVSVTGADQFASYMNDFITNGNYAGSDIVPGSIKAWKSNSSTFSPSSSVLLGSYSKMYSLGAFERLSFNNVYKFFNEGVSYMYLTADIAPTAVSGRSIGLKNMQGDDIFGYSSSMTTEQNSYLSFTPLTFASVGGQSITWATLPTISVTSFPHVATLSATASSGLPVSYTVNTGNATVQNNQLTILSEGQVSITASQSGDEFFTAATPVSQTFNVVSVVSSITLSEEALHTEEISIYPNPAKDFVVVKGINGKCTVEIFDIIGNKVGQQKDRAVLSISKYSKGIYMVVVSTDKGKITRRLIVE